MDVKEAVRDAGDRSRPGAAGRSGRAPGAPVLLAGPRARHLGQPAGRRRGPRRPGSALGRDRQGTRRRARRLQGQGRLGLAAVAAQVARAGDRQGLLHPAEPAQVRAQREEGAEAAPDQPGARGGLQVRLDPDGRAAGRQQRPRRDHARPLHGAEVAPGPAQRPALQPLAAAGGRERRPHPQLRVPGHLPQRSEPGLRPGPRGGRQAAVAAAHRPPRHPGAGARQVRALQPPARGLRRAADRCDHRRRPCVQVERTRRPSPASWSRT